MDWTPIRARRPQRAAPFSDSRGGRPTFLHFRLDLESEEFLGLDFRRAKQKEEVFCTSFCKLVVLHTLHIWQ